MLTTKCISLKKICKTHQEFSVEVQFCFIVFTISILFGWCSPAPPFKVVVVNVQHPEFGFSWLTIQFSN